MRLISRPRARGMLGVGGTRLKAMILSPTGAWDVGRRRAAQPRRRALAHGRVGCWGYECQRQSRLRPASPLGAWANAAIVAASETPLFVRPSEGEPGALLRSA